MSSIAVNLNAPDLSAATLHAALAFEAGCRARAEAVAKVCDALRDPLQQVLRDGRLQPATRAELDRLTQSFLTALQRQHQVLQLALLPALEEAMAGSDAVCLREIGIGLRADQRALETQWRGLMLLLAEHRPAASAAPLTAQLQRLQSLCAREMAFENCELLPMAQRLLDSAQLQALLQPFGTTALPAE